MLSVVFTALCAAPWRPELEQPGLSFQKESNHRYDVNIVLVISHVMKLTIQMATSLP